VKANKKEIHMATIQIGPQDALFYEHTVPGSPGSRTFVFFNALTGDADMWEAVIGPRVREPGHGTLVYNYRGQTNSPFDPDTKLGPQTIVGDAKRVLNEAKPVRPVFVGISIGGLFAAQAWLDDADASGLVLINTLRRDGARLQWINDAMVRCVEVGGLELLRDLLSPHLFAEEWLAANRKDFLKDDPYVPLDRKSGAYKLLADSVEADWDLPYERLTLPTLVITGLKDHIFLEQPDLDNLFSRLPRAKQINLDDAGHLIPAERPEALADALLDFARELK